MPRAASANGRIAEERADAVVVGARCAGSSLAATLAARGRKVVVLDRASFPSDTLSTHAMFPSGCAEFQRIGVWPRIKRELDPPHLTHLEITIDGRTEVRGRWQAVDGIDHGVSLPRNLVDVLLVENARERGADVRERASVDDVMWKHGRVAGVAYTDADGVRRRIRSDVVAGADGRRSTVAAQVGSWRPYRVSKNGRGMVFRYMDDPAHEAWHRRTMWNFRDGDSVAFAFPTPNGRILTLFMGPAGEVSEARSDPEGYWRRKLAQHPSTAERIAGATNPTKIRSTGDTQAYWRAASGPGWALAGDANHFKDPVTGQGMGDALRMGRTLGESIDASLGDPAGLDRALRRWEHETLHHCLHAYHFANADTIARRPPATFVRALRAFDRQAVPGIGRILGRNRRTEEVITPPLMLRATARALWEGPDRMGVARESIQAAKIETAVRRELARNEFRPRGPIEGSDHPGWTWWDEPGAPSLVAETGTEAEPEPATA